MNALMAEIVHKRLKIERATNLLNHVQFINDLTLHYSIYLKSKYSVFIKGERLLGL